MIPPPTTIEHPQERHTDPTARTRCPECDGSLVHDERRGEHRCAECGLVTEEDAIDHGPEWRSYTDTPDNPERVGAPLTPLMHDKGLSSVISAHNRDANGNWLSARQRARARRLRRWDGRSRTNQGRDRNLMQAFTEINRMAAALGLPTPVRETAAVIYRRAVAADLLPGRSIEAVATASLYAAARQHDTPRTLTNTAHVSRVPKLPIQRAYRALATELGLRIEPTDPAQYLQPFASQLDLTDETIRTARDLLDTARAQSLHSGKSPQGLAAAALYAAARLTNESRTQAVISDTVGVSKVTIRNRYQELLDAYEHDPTTHPIRTPPTHAHPD